MIGRGTRQAESALSGFLDSMRGAVCDRACSITSRSGWRIGKGAKEDQDELLAGVVVEVSHAARADIFPLMSPCPQA